MKKLNKQAGMTLVEVLAVIVLIGMIMVVVGKGVMGKGDAAKAKLNVVRMEGIRNALAQYRLELNTYPSSLDSLAHPGKEAVESGQVVVPLIDEKDLKDIWGNNFIYRSEGGRSYSLQTLGSDGVPGGDGAKQDVTMTP
ncbi:MAG: type II secretion system protein GspG [Deltaproteobacteria bacterium]|nr:type II secretion system protein GspG [Deltaproteobacteria bacterium]